MSLSLTGLLCTLHFNTLDTHVPRPHIYIADSSPIPNKELRQNIHPRTAYSEV